MTDAAREARNAYKREWDRKNADRVKSYQKAWRQANKDRIKAYNANYWERKAAGAGDPVQ